MDINSSNINLIEFHLLITKSVGQILTVDPEVIRPIELHSIKEIYI
jgi:hypothetical protein